MLLIFVFLAAPVMKAQQKASLSESEVDKLRDTQDPGERIKVYMDFMQIRLLTFENYRSRPVDPQYRMGKFLNEVLGQYVDLDDELKDWIQFQYSRDGDMRGGLRDFLDRAPRQLEELKHAQQTPDPYATKYSENLANAIADLEDTLDGATTAYGGQVKKFGELKQADREEKKAAQSEAKEEKKRIREEQKLRKKEQKSQQNPEPGND
ncbi:MAG TPA: hypothetical protein VGY31_05780 [Terriglobia bacterium]|nr:hypothetical protein [Terriglobia bacterium]